MELLSLSCFFDDKRKNKWKQLVVDPTNFKMKCKVLIWKDSLLIVIVIALHGSLALTEKFAPLPEISHNKVSFLTAFPDIFGAMSEMGWAHNYSLDIRSDNWTWTDTSPRVPGESSTGLDVFLQSTIWTVNQISR